MSFVLFRPSVRTPSAKTAYENDEDLNKILLEARPLHVEDVTSFKSLRGEVMFELQNVGKVKS